MNKKTNQETEDEVALLRQRIAELERNEVTLIEMNKVIQADKERLKIQYRLTNIPTITWQKKGTDFIVADYNITMEEFTDGLIGNYLNKRASLLYADRPDIQVDLHTCFNDQRLIKRETPYQMFTSKINKTIILTFTFVPPDSVISHMEDITDRKMAEQKLLLSKKQLRALSTQLINVEEVWKKHISRELHDSIGQYLTAVKISMENTRQELLEKRDILKAATLLESGLNLLKQTSDEVHRITMDLRPSILDDLGILATISWICREFQAISTSMKVEQDIQIKEEDVPEPLKIIIYRILQEALNNAVKHSSASHVRISLTSVNKRIQLLVEDNGKGFDLKQVATNYDVSAPEGLGLMIMKERAKLSGGVLKIHTQLNKGTSIFTSW